MSGHWYRDLEYGETYHPATLWGRLVVLGCFVVMFILWVTNIVPYALQPTVIAFLVAFMLAGFVLSMVGYFRYWGKERLLFMVTVIFVVATLAIVWFLAG